MAKSRDFVSPRNSRNQKTTRTSSFRHVVCLTMAATVATMSLGFSGCCSRNGCSGGGWGFADRIIEEQVNCLRDCVWSKRAFHMRFGHCERVHADHFKEGFCSGYTNICDGGTGQCPALPPEKYWSFEYRTREGAEMQNAWFAGYEAGASAAKTDGAGSFYGVQVHRDMINDLLREEQVKNQQSGIRVEGPQGLAPVMDSSEMEMGGTQSTMPYTQSSVPFTNTPYVPGNVVTGASAVPVTSQVIPDAGTATSQGTRSGPPLPMQMMPSTIPSVPAVPQR